MHDRDGAAAAVVNARLRVALKKAGRTIPANGAWIAAAALSTDCQS